MVEDKGSQEALLIPSADTNYEFPSRKTMWKKPQQLCEDEGEVKQCAMKTGDQTGDHQTSVSDNRYLDVTAHIIDDDGNSIIGSEWAESTSRPFWRCLCRGLKWDYFHVYGMTH